MRNIYKIFVLLICLSGLLLGQSSHVLLSEAVATPTTGEYIEIVNTTGAAVDLTNYYLSDDQDYALLPGAYGAGPAPDIVASDFIAQFPAGTIIPGGGVIVVAFDGAGFTTEYGITADFEILALDENTPDMIATNVGETAGITNSGECAVLFYWDGLSDLVMDVDLVNIGTPSATNTFLDKGTLSVDGPDADTDASTYLTDALTMPQMIADPGFGFSAKRINFEDGEEVFTGGNGITGHDESTENILVTWTSEDFTAPDPGVVDEGLPVELSSFSAIVKADVVELIWKTASEINNQGFDVERSISGENKWETLGFVKGAGSTTEAQNYSFSDKVALAGTYSYRLKQVDLDGTYEYSNVIEVNFGVPSDFVVEQNYPNPFNPATTIKFAIPTESMVNLTVFNSLGEQVTTLLSEVKAAGYHTVNFDASKLSSGLYFYSIQAGDFVSVKKMMLIK